MTEATNATDTAAEKFSYDGERIFFSAADLASGLVVETAEKITALNIPAVTYNKPWPDNAGAVIIPLRKRVEKQGAKEGDPKETKLFGILLWPSWSLQDVLAHDKGAENLEEIWRESQVKSITSALLRTDFSVLGKTNPQTNQPHEIDTSGCPDSLRDILEGVTGDRGKFKSYNAAIANILPKLKKMNEAIFKHMSPPQIRQFLSSQSHAKALAPELEANGFWAKLITVLEDEAKRLDMSTEIFNEWRTTREAPTTEQSINFDVDLSQLA